MQVSGCNIAPGGLSAPSLPAPFRIGCAPHIIIDHLYSSAAPDPSRGPDQTRRADGSEASSVEAAGFTFQKEEAKVFFHSLYLSCLL